MRDHTHEFLLSLPSHSTADRKALLLKHDQAEERQSCEPGVSIVYAVHFD